MCSNHGLMSQHVLPVQRMPPTYADQQFGFGSGSLSGSMGGLPTMPSPPDSWRGQHPYGGMDYGRHDPHGNHGLGQPYMQYDGRSPMPSQQEISRHYLPQQQQAQTHMGIRQHLAQNPCHDPYKIPTGPAPAMHVRGGGAPNAPSMPPAASSTAQGFGLDRSVGHLSAANQQMIHGMMGQPPFRHNMPQSNGVGAQPGRGSFDKAPSPDGKPKERQASAAPLTHQGVGPPPPRDFTNTFKDSSSYLASPAASERPRDYETGSDYESGSDVDTSNLGTDRYAPRPPRRDRSNSKQESSCIRCVMPCLVTC